MPENSHTHPSPGFGDLVTREHTHHVDGEEQLLRGLQEGAEDVDGGLEGGGGSSIPHSHHWLVGHPDAQLQRQRAGEDLGELQGQGEVRARGLCVAGASGGVRNQCRGGRWLTWGMAGRRAEVDSTMLSGTCGNSRSSVGGRESWCKAHAGLSCTPRTDASTWQ